MNDEALIRRFMKEIADREFSDWVAKKSDTPRRAGGLMSWAASKAVGPWV